MGSVQHEHAFGGDFPAMLGMLAWLSGAAVFGGALGTAKAARFSAAGFASSIVLGLVFGTLVGAAVWYGGQKAFVALSERRASLGRLPWKYVLPVWSIVILCSMFLCACLGAMLVLLIVR